MVAMSRADISPIALAGGGTAGHVYPAGAVVAGMGGTAIWLGREAGMERHLARDLGIPFAATGAGAVAGRNALQLLQSALANLRGFLSARHILSERHPYALFATGGYVSVPPVLAARSLSIPVILFLPDIEPGLAIRFLARFASAIVCTAAESARYLRGASVVPTGYPVRPELRAWSGRPDRRAAARSELGIGEDPVILVMGGSQGARAINEAVWTALPRLVGGATVLHQTGLAGADDSLRARRSLPEWLQDRYRPTPFVSLELGMWLAAADLFVGRAGASTLGELPAFSLPALLIPGSFAGGHQRANAAYLARQGAAHIYTSPLPESAAALAQEALALLYDRAGQEQRRTAMGLLDRPGSIDAIRATIARFAFEDAR